MWPAASSSTAGKGRSGWRCAFSTWRRRSPWRRGKGRAKDALQGKSPAGIFVRFLITGTAGFIGFHLARRLLADGHAVVGIDGLTPYYDVALKKARHAELARAPGFTPHVAMLEDADKLAAIYAAAKPDAVIHLAAQAGVRYSLENPRPYIDANLVGTFNLLERLRAAPPKHFLFASTSSIYGADPPPAAETDPADHPLSLYAATKKAGELMAHAYAP